MVITINLKSIKSNLNQIAALTEKNLKLRLRFKYAFVLQLLTPFVAVMMPFFVLSKFFEYNNGLGSWTENNLILFQLLAINLYSVIMIIQNFERSFFFEKFWNTLPIIILGPFNRFNLIFSIFLTRLIMISGPVIIIFILCYIIYPISILTLISVISIYLLIALIFSGVGLTLGIFVISKENLFNFFDFIFAFVFLFSCITYPFEMFPDSIQAIITLNPFYYLFDILRLTWIEDNLLTSITLHPFHFLVLIISAICFPIIGVSIFNIVFKKLGIIGY